MSDSFHYNPFLPLYRDDPYPIYHKLRCEEPIYWSSSNAWIVSRYSDVLAVLNDPRFEHWTVGIPQQGALHQALHRWLHLMSPRSHSTLRSLTVQILSQSRIQELRPYIQSLANDLLVPLRHKGEMEVLEEYASPLALSVAGQLLGVEKSESVQFLRIAQRVVNDLFEDSGTVQSQMPLLQEYMMDLIECKRITPGADLISALLRACNEKQELAPDDLFGMCLLFLFAGHENTRSAIGNAILALIYFQDQQDLLRARPSLMGNAVDELLRYDPPVQFVTLAATESVEIGGQTIKQGDPVLLALGSANRDPRQFEDPDRPLITRTNNPHLTFGHGPFFCIGAMLAHAEIEIALHTLLQSAIHIRLMNDKLHWRERPPVLRGLKQLFVLFDPVEHA